MINLFKKFNYVKFIIKIESATGTSSIDYGIREDSPNHWNIYIKKYSGSWVKRHGPFLSETLAMNFIEEIKAEIKNKIEKFKKENAIIIKKRNFSEVIKEQIEKRNAKS